MKKLQSTILNLTPVWLLLLAPFLLFPSPKKALALLGLPLLWALRRWGKGHFIQRTPFDWSIFTVLLMVLVSIYATFDLTFSLAKLCGILFHVAIFYAVIDAVQTRQGLQRSLAVYFLFGLAIAGLGLIGTNWLFKIEAISAITRRLPQMVQGLAGAETGISSNQLAGTLLWFFPLPISLLWASRKSEPDSGWALRKPLVSAVVLSVTGFVFFLTQSRGGWVGGLVAVAMLGALWDKRIRLLALAGTLAAIIGASVIGWSTVGELLVSDSTEAVVGNLSSLGFRFEVWRAALWGLADFPFTGMGLGTFREVSRVLYPMNISPTYDIAHAHNHFLQTGLDLGLLGLAAYGSMWFIAAFLLAQTIRQTEDRFIKAMSIGVSACLTGYFVYGLTDTVALGAKPGLFWWWLLAFCVGLYRQSQAATEGE